MKSNNISLNPIFLTGLSVFFLALSSCSSNEKKPGTPEIENDYPISTVDIRKVHLTDNFWKPILHRVKEITIPYAIAKCEAEGRLDNFLIAGGKMKGKTRGVFPFEDSDVYKIIEGAAISMMSEPDPELDKLLDSLIAIIAVGQESDGYLTTWRTIDPASPPATWVGVKEEKRWESLEASHELYNAGHMYEAAAAHYRATGKPDFLNIALKNADLVVKTFGDGENQISAVPGHQIIETGLIQLYRINSEKKYLDMAKYFLDNRGNPENHELYGSYENAEYTQDHLPPVEQDEAVGHAVRAMYMYAGMTDVATLENDRDYQRAVEKIWENITHKKTYITGGIGARRQGEAFGDNYELPNKTGYNETCAAIGSVCWNQRLFRQSGNVKYYDVIERTLYNGLISGLSLDGTHFFYPNPLESDGEYAFNQGACTRSSWFDCSCCPTNLIRFLPRVPEFIYATREDTLFVNLYIASNASAELKNSELDIDMKADYPWSGKVSLEVKSSNSNPVSLKLRIPGWARNQVLPGDLYQYATSLNKTPGIETSNPDIEVKTDGNYFILTGNWQDAATVNIDFPMEVRKVRANDKVEEDRNKTALERGPLVYAIEEVDNRDFDEIKMGKQDSYTVEMRENLLGGVNVIHTDSFIAVPYYSWSNRGIGKMKVWIDLSLLDK